MNKVPLSVAIITKNEETDLPGCLESVLFAAEVVIVDCGSVDRTADIAKEFGARFLVEPWKGYGPQKNSALEKCSYDWVLTLDADERVPPETALKIEELVLGQGGADGYSFRRKNLFHGKWISSTDWWPDEVTRLIKKNKSRFEGLTHERLVVDGLTKRLKCCIEHFSYNSYSELFTKLDGYSTEQAGQMLAAGKRAGPCDALFRGAWMFFRNYFLRLGFSAGFDGFVISLSKGLGTFLKYAKLYELTNSGRKGLASKEKTP
ncbi:MAG: glycosyltransferase family 2 protein [Syntrophobacteraceae bacterium]|nr:glycosyltransferase family 2 protein [Syntrophobacteraceae bacterium]